jgi:hypothetical protein
MADQIKMLLEKLAQSRLVLEGIQQQMHHPLGWIVEEVLDKQQQLGTMLNEIRAEAEHILVTHDDLNKFESLMAGLEDVQTDFQRLRAVAQAVERDVENAVWTEEICATIQLELADLPCRDYRRSN